MEIELAVLNEQGQAQGVLAPQGQKPGEAGEPEGADAAALARVGKKEVFKRNFGYVTIVSFSCTILATWEGVLILLTPGLENGGPLGLLLQFLLVWAGTLCTFASIGEMASMAPTSGGQYHWVEMLSPKSVRSFLGYLTGWMNVLAWLATVSTGTFLCATMAQGLAIISNPDYVPQGWHSTLMTWAFIAMAVFFTTYVGNVLPQIECVMLILHVFGYFGIMIPLVFFAPHAKASDLFATFLNAGNWPDNGLSFMVGTLGLAFSFVGADAAVHMSEEIANAAMNVPRAICASIAINGALGFGMLIAVVFSLGNINAALTGQSQTGFAFIEVFQQATWSLGGTTAMTSLLILLAFSASVGFLATASRMIWSFARDKGLPCHEALGKVHQRTRIPLCAIAMASVGPALIVLINIGSSVVFNDVTSLALVGFYSTYFIPVALLLYCRLTGGIRSRREDEAAGAPMYDAERDEYDLTWGPWHIKGAWGVVNNVVACAYLLVIWFFGFWPPSIPVDASTMNYSSLVFGTVVICCVIHYLIWGRKQYKGPIIEIVTERTPGREQS